MARRQRRTCRKAWRPERVPAAPVTRLYALMTDQGPQAARGLHNKDQADGQAHVGCISHQIYDYTIRNIVSAYDAPEPSSPSISPSSTSDIAVQPLRDSRARIERIPGSSATDTSA